MQTKHTVAVSKDNVAKENGQVFETELRINWPDTDAPQWLIDIARKSIVISWQSQMRSAMNAKENPLKKVEKAYEINAEDYKPKERRTEKEKLATSVKKMLAEGKLTREELDDLLEG